MVRILEGIVTDQDGQALQSVPDGWTVMRIRLGWVAYRTWELTDEGYTPLGPFETAGEAVDAACREELEARP